MDAFHRFVAEHRTLLIVAFTVFALSIVSKIILQRVTNTIVERFQVGATAPEPSDSANLVVPKTEPTLQQGDCDILKKTLDALRLSEQAKASAEFTKSDLFKSIKSEMEDKYRTLECDAYLKKLASGEVSAAQTPPDMRPSSIPPIQI